MKKYLLIILAIFLVGTIVSVCFGRSGNSVQLVEKPIRNCETTQLYQFLKSHIENSPRILNKDGSPGEKVYYYAYFFTKDADYVTIWKSPVEIYMDKIDSLNKKRKLIYEYLYVSHYDFVIISDRKINQSNLFRPCKDCFLSIDGLPQLPIIEFDGPTYPRTYKYYEKAGKYVFEAQDKYDISFLGQEHIEWEKAASKNERENYESIKRYYNLE